MVFTRFENMEDFLAKYKAAHKSKLKIEELAYIMNVKPDTIARRKITVKHHMGVELPQLKRYGGDLKKVNSVIPSEESNEKFCRELAKLEEANKRFVVEEKREKRKIYVITSAQNATPIFTSFLDCIKVYLRERNAELMVIPNRYRNPTSIWSDMNKDNEWWDHRIQKYLVEKRVKLNNNIDIMGNIKIQPTAVNPLSGFETYTGESSAIFGHPSIQLKSVPTPAKSMPKILSTTGSITQPNYTDSKAGHKGEFNHCYAGTIVEIDGDAFYTRHIHANDDGEFYDLDRYYTADGSRKTDSIPALITGDIHAVFHDENVEKATYTNDDSIVNTLKPENWVIHDLEDFYSRNHHHRDNDILAFGKHHFKKRDNVEESLQISADFVDKHSRPFMQNIIVRSNHDEAFDRWLKEADPKKDPENALFYHYMKYYQYKNVVETPTSYKTIDAFEFWCKNPESCRGLANIENTTFLSRDERDPKRVIKGIEIGYHGDKGPNGTRGNLSNLSKMGPKIIIGHSHTPGILHGTYQVGVSARIDLEYASGPSSWLHTHCLIYPDGHRTLIHIVKGKWRL